MGSQEEAAVLYGFCTFPGDSRKSRSNYNCLFYIQAGHYRKGWQCFALNHVKMSPYKNNSQHNRTSSPTMGSVRCYLYVAAVQNLATTDEDHCTARSRGPNHRRHRTSAILANIYVEHLGTYKHSNTHAHTYKYHYFFSSFWCSGTFIHRYIHRCC